MTAVIAGNAVVVTNCTGRKRGVQHRLAMSAARLGGPTSQVAQCWVADLHRHPARVTANDYYAGRGYAEAQRAAAQIGAPVAVVSAGLGLIWSDADVPAYDVTIGGGANSVADHLICRGESPADWWRELTRAWGDPQPFDRLMHQCPDAVVLVAMPSTYLRMVQGELASLSANQQRRLRIFSSAAGCADLPDALLQQAMPYDDRLEGTILPGTQSDFPQRALRHFVEVLGAFRLDAPAARTMVADALSYARRPQIPARGRRTDEQIIESLHANWQTYNGESSKLLRYLRDDALVACEQSRFKNLWHQVRAERQQEA